MIQEICFIEVDELCWNSVLDRLEGIDYFKVLTKIQNENSENFEHQTHRHIPQFFPMNIHVSHADKPSNGYHH
jgi:hypothetical protein